MGLFNSAVRLGIGILLAAIHESDEWDAHLDVGREKEYGLERDSAL